MPSPRYRRAAAVLLIAVVVTGMPSASARPVTNPLCDQEDYREAHPLICDTHAGGPFTLPPGGGGEENMGLIERILNGIGGLLG